MTEQQIEARAERAMDILDIRYMRGAISQDAYNDAVRDLDRWTQQKLQQARSS